MISCGGFQLAICFPERERLEIEERCMCVWGGGRGFAEIEMVKWPADKQVFLFQGTAELEF